MRWLKLQADFFTHRKTLALRARIGRDAYWVPLRILAEAALCWPDGILEGIDPPTLAGRIDYPGDPAALFEALFDAGFLDRDPLRIHDWEERQAFHAHIAARARHAAQARWSPPLPPSKKRGEESTGHGAPHEPRMTDASPKHRPSIADLRAARTAKERLAAEILEAASYETAHGRTWRNPARQGEWKRLRAGIRDLDRQIADL